MTNCTTCSRCVMDTSAYGIIFDASGVCNYCSDLDYRQRSAEVSERRTSSALSSLVSTIKRNNSHKKYDCIIGVSGGVDSSWTLVLAKEMGLRPLAVHMDNGWNSELAQHNIENLVNKLGIDLHTYVIDWDEYRSLMQAFFDADVIDVELLYDNAMLAVNYMLASKYSLHYILAGTNQATEGMRMPDNWSWYKCDKRNILSIAKSKNVKISTFPSLGTFGRLFHRVYHHTKWIHFLDYTDYNKEQALLQLESKYGYRRYPYKHYESIFTRFYQGHILPVKFGIDKRKIHLSTLILNGQLCRSEALEILSCEPYPSPNDLDSDINYFLRKMRWTQEQLEDYLSRPAQPHSRFYSELSRYHLLLRLRSFLGKSLA